MNTCCGTPTDVVAPLQTTLLFGAGFLTSLGHCSGMCGPLVCAFGGRDHRAPAVAYGSYQFGRVLSYALLGTLFGALGALPGVLASLRDGLGVITLAFGVLMGLGALAFGGWSLFPRRTAGSSLHSRLGAVSRTVGRPLRRLGPVGWGMANGLLPCGPIALVALAAAATQSPLQGALALTTFGLGTVPVVLLWMVGGRTLSHRTRLVTQRVGAAFVFALGLQLTLRGAASLGYVPHLEVASWVLW